MMQSKCMYSPCCTSLGSFLYLPLIESPSYILSCPFSSVMRKAVAEALPRREQMKEMQDSCKDDLLWTSPGSLAANNLLLEVVNKCLPPPSQHASAVYLKARAAIDAHDCVRTSLDNGAFAYEIPNSGSQISDPGSEITVRPS